MKILFYRNKLNRGGIGRVMTNLANMFGENNETIFVTLREYPNEYGLNRNVKRYNMDARAKASSIISDIPLFFKMAVKLRKIIRQEKPDVVVTFMQLDSLFIFLSKLFLGIPHIVSVRSDPYVELSKIHKRVIYKTLYSFVDGCVFQTEVAKQFFSSKIQSKSVIINNLIDTNLFAIKPMDKRKDIIGIGRLVPQKAWQVAIKAFSIVSADINDNFIIYGEGPDHTMLNDYINELGLTGRIFLAGITTDIEKKIANSKLFLFSPDFEGLPNALIEALIIGTPCISTNFTGGGAEMLIESGVNGILVPIGDFEAMAKAILKVITDDDYAELLSRNAKESTRAKYDPARIFSQWESYIISTVKKRQFITGG